MSGASGDAVRCRAGRPGGGGGGRTHRTGGLRSFRRCAPARRGRGQSCRAHGVRPGPHRPEERRGAPGPWPRPPGRGRRHPEAAAPGPPRPPSAPSGSASPGSASSGTVSPSSVSPGSASSGTVSPSSVSSGSASSGFASTTVRTVRLRAAPAAAPRPERATPFPGRSRTPGARAERTRHRGPGARPERTRHRGPGGHAHLGAAGAGAAAVWRLRPGFRKVSPLSRGTGEPESGSGDDGD